MKARPISVRTITKLQSATVLPALTFVSFRITSPRCRTTPNPALDLAPFGRWTLRDKAAQRRSALRWALTGEGA